MNDVLKHLEYLDKISETDVKAVRHSDVQYNASWKARGGVGAYFVAIRKYDRLEARAKQAGYDVFEAVRTDLRPEGIIDDIRDLRRYLLLWEAELMNRGIIIPELPKNEPDYGSGNVSWQENFPGRLDRLENTSKEGEIPHQECLLEAAKLMCSLCKKGDPFIGTPKDGLSWMHNVFHVGGSYTSKCMARPIYTELKNRGWVYELPSSQ